MNTSTKVNVRKNPPATLGVILQEIRILRRDLDLVVPQEKLSDYTHPTRIKNNLAKALRAYPKK